MANISKGVKKALTPHERIDRVERMIQDMRKQLGEELAPVKQANYEHSREITNLHERCQLRDNLIDDFSKRLFKIEGTVLSVHTAAEREQHMLGMLKAVVERIDNDLRSTERQIKALFARTNGDKKKKEPEQSAMDFTGPTMADLDFLLRAYGNSNYITHRMVHTCVTELKARRLREQGGA